MEANAGQPSGQSLSREQSRALLEVSESIASHHDLEGLFDELAERLQAVVGFDFVTLVLHDPAANVMRLRILRSLRPAVPPPVRELPLEDSPSALAWQSQEPLVIRPQEETRFPAIVSYLREQGIRSAVLFPLTTAQRRLGAMGFGSAREEAFDAGALEFLGQVARQVAVAVDNALHHQEAQSYQRQLARERDRLQALLEVNNAIVSQLDLRELFNAISRSLRRLLQCDYVSLALYEPEGNRMRVQALDFPGGKGLIQEEMTAPLDQTPAGAAFATRRPVLLGRAEIDRLPLPMLADEGMHSLLCLPLVTLDRALGTLNLASRAETAFSQEDVDFLMRAAAQIAIAVENALAFRRIEEQKDRLAEEKLYLEREIQTEYNFEEIVGESEAWKRVLAQARTVAPTDTTALLLGETGTGKELLARLIHQSSARRDRTFVKLNCAAIPTGLLESELFGHEKGAFTGAISRRIGRFELADGGTLFLDEIGDIPLELQPKLLRVLQEREFERLGSTRTLRVNVRLIAATNRNLAEMVEAGEFRPDLYYRVNIFPIAVPPLRDRREDIPFLARYFVEKHSARMNKRIEEIPAETMEALTRYAWPGNARELENFIERAVILSPGPALRLPLAELRGHARVAAVPATLADAERDHIVRVLEEANWRIGGPGGAAAQLGVKRTTLQSKMQKLGISRPRRLAR
jgi:formate hydrogenlyase transcriptional activator